MKHLFRLSFIALLLFVMSVALAQTEGASLDERGYGLYIPTTYGEDGEDALPLVIALHGFGDTWDNFADASGLMLVAEHANFIVAFPQGYLRQWNDGSQGEHYEDDVQLLRDLIERIDRDYRIDHERIYLAGFSNGSTMTYHAACEAPDLFAGIAAISGTMRFGTYDNCDENTALPILMIHGTGDLVVPFNGNRANRRMSVPDAVLTWAEHNGCNTEDVPEFDESRFRNGFTIYYYDDCLDDNIVMLHALEGVGHTWVGAEYYFRGMFPPQLQFDTAQMIWGFFERSHRLKTATDDNPEMTPEATESADE